MAPAASKLAHTDDGGSICDRLSALPDELVLHVLSFLQASEVVRTSVLSKRWKDLWRSVLSINLDFTDFFRGPSEPDPWRATWVRMDNFVSNLLMLHEAPRLDAFRLTAHNVGHDSRRHFDTWIRRAIRGDPLVLKLWMMGFNGMDGFYRLPYLGSSSPCFRRLKRLKLAGGIVLDHSFAQRLHSWWPQLEDLDLTHCYLGFSRIESYILKNLTIVYCKNPSVDGFVIRAPGLATLKLAICSGSHGYRNGISLYVGNSPARASIKLERGKFSPRCEAMILGSLVNAASLDLKNFQAMAILDKELFDKLPRFNNTRTLTLNSFGRNSSDCDVHNLKALGRILQMSPNMENLTLEYYKVSKGSTARKGRKGKSKKTYPANMVRLHCPMLKSTELIYYGRRNASILALHRFLQDICSAPNNLIKFTNTKYCQ
ncbi:unnamed protein product [Urochloa decumbens]|uniref:F-box domain-containing protein n=1 Tax=Urochloa decumbens TaxID=240449 RepID=A0ABC9F1A0_9POAL